MKNLMIIAVLVGGGVSAYAGDADVTAMADGAVSTWTAVKLIVISIVSTFILMKLVGATLRGWGHGQD